MEEVEKYDLYLRHRIGKSKEDGNNSRIITAKFSKYNIRDKVFKKLE